MKKYTWGFALFASACLANPQKERFDLNKDIGKITVQDVDMQVKYAPLNLVNGIIEARAQRPTVEVSFASRNPAATTINFKLTNMRQTALPIASTGAITAGPRAGIVNWQINVAAGAQFTATVENFPGGSGPYRFGVVGDMHHRNSTATLIAESAASRNLDFFISVGDFVNQPSDDEYNWALAISEKFGGPVYSAYGNHEGFRGGYLAYYRRLFGTTNYSFTHKGDFFLFLDSADQSLSREIFDFAESELGASASGLKMTFMHVPPFDAVGMRNNSFNSRYQAARFMNMMLDKNAKLSVAGHVHTYQDFYVDAVRNIVVGTGGGRPEQFDGVGIRYVVIHSDGTGSYSLETVDLGDD